MRFVKTAATLAVGLVLGASAVVVAETAPQQYTGCLTKDGTLYKVAVGTSAKLACAKTETQITWSSVGPQGAGSACTVGGKAGTLSYAVDSTTGAVTLSCLWNAHTISVAVTNGTLQNIDIRFPASDGTICSNAATCSFTFDSGTSYSAVLLSNGSTFRYDCGDGTMQQATMSAGVWNGGCGGTGVDGWSPFTSDHEVSVDVFYRVGGTVTNGETADFYVRDLTNNTYPADCDGVSTCAADVLGGHKVIVEVAYPTYFSITCPGGTEQFVEWTAYCSTTSLSSDYMVTVKGW